MDALLASCCQIVVEVVFFFGSSRASPSCGVHLKMLNVLGLAQASLCHPSLRVVHMLIHSDGLLLLACVFFVVVLSLLWRGRMCGHADWEWSKSACV